MLDLGVKYGGQQKVVMLIVLQTYPLDPCLFLSNRLHMAAVTGLPARLPAFLSLQNRRAEWKQLHSGPSGIHAEMKRSNASGPRTDFLMCESCAVFTDVFCLHFLDLLIQRLSPLFLHIGVGLLRELEGDVSGVLLGNQLVKITLQVLGKANGEKGKAGWREGVKRWL